MPDRPDRLLIQDMLESISKIRIYMTGYSKTDFENDSRTVDAVIRNLEIIGEAATKTSEDLKDSTPEINWFQLRGLRNRIVHDYVGIDYNIIWDIVNQRLEQLEQDLLSILNHL